MAHISIHDYVGIGLDFSRHTATSYQIAKDSEFKLIIDQSIRDTQHKEIWYSPLPKREEDGPGFYNNRCKLYARFKLHFGDTIESPWCEFILDNQRRQDVVITSEFNNNVAYSNSRDLEWETECGVNPSKPFEEIVDNIYEQLGTPIGAIPGGDAGGSTKPPTGEGSGNGGNDNSGTIGDIIDSLSYFLHKRGHPTQVESTHTFNDTEYGHIEVELETNAPKLKQTYNLPTGWTIECGDITDILHLYLHRKNNPDEISQYLTFNKRSDIYVEVYIDTNVDDVNTSTNLSSAYSVKCTLV